MAERSARAIEPLPGRRGQHLVLDLPPRPVSAIVDPEWIERFYRPKTESDRRTQGSGLGLPIAKALVELHGGRIWVESRPGNGATFRIALTKRQAGTSTR